MPWQRLLWSDAHLARQGLGDTDASVLADGFVHVFAQPGPAWGEEVPEAQQEEEGAVFVFAF